MQIFLFINCNDQHRLGGVEQLFCKLQPLLHHGEPFAVAILVAAVNIVVVVFPITRTRVVRRIDIDAIHLAGI